MNQNIYHFLSQATLSPDPFSNYTARDLWDDAHIASRMLEFHLNPDLDIASRKHRTIQESVRWITQNTQLSIGDCVVDFGCGPGLYSRLFAEAGMRVTGVDFSLNSIQYARERRDAYRHPVNYIHANYLELELPEASADLVCMIMYDLCALSPRQRLAMLHRFHRVLKSGGYALFDVFSLKAFAKREPLQKLSFHPEGGFWAPKSYVELLQTMKYNSKVVLDRYHIIKETGVKIVDNWLQYFDLKTLSNECESAGFKVQAVFQDLTGQPYQDSSEEFAVLLKKR